MDESESALMKEAKSVKITQMQRSQIWRLDHPESKIIEQIHEGENVKYRVRWACVSHTNYNLYPDNGYNTSIETREHLEVEAPKLIREFERNPNGIKTKFVVEKIIGKRSINGRKEYEVVWAGTGNKPSWEPEETLLEDDEVANLVDAFEEGRDPIGNDEDDDEDDSSSSDDEEDDVDDSDEEEEEEETDDANMPSTSAKCSS
jgi:hypothetical protein